MSWIIACDRGRSVVSGNSLAHDGLMTRGTFMVEFALQSADLRPRKLIDYERSATWARVFILYLNADGSVSVENRQGRSCSYARVNTPIRFPGRVRVTYNWDGPERLGMLSLESLDSGAFAQAVFADPVPNADAAISTLYSLTPVVEFTMLFRATVTGCVPAWVNDTPNRVSFQIWVNCQMTVTTMIGSTGARRSTRISEKTRPRPLWRPCQLGRDRDVVVSERL